VSGAQLSGHIQYQFSFDYMKKVVQFYDEKDKRTGKRKYSFPNVERHFKRVKEKSFIDRFRKYIESYGTKKQKLDQIDSFVYESFQNARQQLLSVHDIDLKNWALKNAAELYDNTFVVTQLHPIYQLT
jgi:hypothetical protein